MKFKFVLPFLILANVACAEEARFLMDVGVYKCESVYRVESCSSHDLSTLSVSMELEATSYNALLLVGTYCTTMTVDHVNFKYVVQVIKDLRPEA